ncbi:MAG: hypothetical protein EA376_05310 [Phycisphaeraceae bacterium]|nr:MAG: hypothetical protein EA376_05310 [Phycisphaeraceae bacterium]
MRIHTAAAAGLGLGVALIASAGAERAAADPVSLTGIQDFDMTAVFRPLFSSFPDRNAITTQARWQVNGDMTGSTGTLGIFTVFDINGADLRPAAGAASVDSLIFDLFPAVNMDTGTGGIQGAGDLSIYFTTNNEDLLDPDSDIIFDNGGGTDPTGLGSQFANLTLLSSDFQDAGIYDIQRTADISGLESFLLNAINNEENIRFIFASQTGNFTSQFGTGNPDMSSSFDFFGEAPVVTFDVTAVPAPGGAALLALAGLAGARRRR